MSKKDQQSADSQKSRRDFLKKMGIAAGAVAVTGGGLGLAKALAGGNKSSEQVQVMTTDGRLAMVDKEDIAERSSSDMAREGREGLRGTKFVMVIDLSRAAMPVSAWRHVRSIMSSGLSSTTSTCSRCRIHSKQLRITCPNPASIATIRPAPRCVLLTPPTSVKMALC
jgi:hypothetical protein